MQFVIKTENLSQSVLLFKEINAYVDLRMYFFIREQMKV